jgi:uncharacterized protein (DUF305 family)
MESKSEKMTGTAYQKFGVTMAISFIIMYGIMFLNVSETNHIYLSLTRMYMTLLMISTMAIVMLLMMGKMYTNKKINSFIIIVSVLVFGLVFTALRTQTPVGDEQYMKAMIPHHSSAIMTSENANIQDPELRKLADDIIKAQKKEIAQMKAILDRLDR